MKNNLAILVSVALGMMTCQSPKEDPALEAEPLRADIVLEPTDSRLNKLTAEILSRGEYPDTIFCNGIVQAPPQSIHSVYSLLRGFVHTIAVYPGSLVRKGQLLCKISHPDIFSVQQRFISQYSKFKTDSLEFVRQQMLFNDSATSARQFEMAKSDYYNSLATYLAQKKYLSSIGFDIGKILEGQLYTDVLILSPSDGIVSSVFTNSGSLIENNTHLFTILNTSHIHFELFIQPSDYHKVRDVEYAFVSALSDTTYRKVRVVNVSTFVENSSMSIVLHCHAVDQSHTPIVGETISAYFLTNFEKGYAVPRNSVFHFNNRDYIFAKTGINHFQLKEVSIMRKYPTFFVVDMSDGRDIHVVTKGSEFLKEIFIKED
ncbi:MAG: efflux RND transporter periplasmic adaptor subunit [Thermaurantimonas sp.]